MSSAPTAQEYFDAKRKHLPSMDHAQYMDFAESYADFVVEFEKKGGDLKQCERWPDTRVGRMVDY